MSVWKCNTCAGQYVDVQADGSLYFHACPAQPPVGVAPPQPFANPRNENIVLDGKGRAAGIKAPGAGVTGVGLPTTPQPVTIPPIIPVGL